jgi:hypothetical protein
MSNEHLMGPSVSVTFFPGTRQPEVIVATKREEPRSLLEHIATGM